MTASLDIVRGNVVLREMCLEPEGPIEREVWRMDLHPGNLRTLWEKASKFKMLFGEEISGDFKKFAEVFLHQNGDELSVDLNGIFWVIDDFVGVYYMTNIRAGVDAIVHYSFFDRRRKGRLELTKSMMRYVFERYKFRRLSTEIGLHTTVDAFKMAEQLGFRKEGRKRAAMYFDNKWFDVNCYGLLREELR